MGGTILWEGPGRERTSLYISICSNFFLYLCIHVLTCWQVAKGNGNPSQAWSVGWFRLGPALIMKIYKNYNKSPHFDDYCIESAFHQQQHLSNGFSGTIFCELNMVFLWSFQALTLQPPHFLCPKNAFVQPPTWPRPRGSGASRCNAERTKHRLGLPASMLPSCCRTWLSRFGLEENVDKRQSGKTKVRL